MELPTTEFRHELEFTSSVVPRLAAILGYAELETFYDHATGEGRRRADVVFSKEVEACPWIVVEVKNFKARNPGDWVYQLRHYLDALGTHLGVILSPELLIIVDDSKKRRSYRLNDLTIEDAEEIFVSLSRARQPPAKPQAEVSRSNFLNLVEAVEHGKTNTEKGRSLEELARFMLSGIPPLNCKHTNLRTRSSEIDLVIEYSGIEQRIPLFEELGRYCLVECKNWSNPVGVGPVRDFIGKLEKSKTRLGLIFSKSGITGAHGGADALREILSLFDRTGAYILVFSLEEIRSITDSLTFMSALDRKADSLRFDIAGG